MKKLLFFLAVALVAAAGGRWMATRTSAGSAAPAGWKVVSYRGVGIDVPKSWTVAPWTLPCPVGSPMVFIGPENPSLIGMSCPPPPGPQSAEVVLGAYVPPDIGVPWQTRTLHGLTAEVTSFHDTLPPSEPRTDLWVRLPSRGFAISVSVGDVRSAQTGGAPGRAERIVNSIHLVRS